MRISQKMVDELIKGYNNIGIEYRLVKLELLGNANTPYYKYNLVLDENEVYKEHILKNESLKNIYEYLK